MLNGHAATSKNSRRQIGSRMRSNEIRLHAGDDVRRVARLGDGDVAARRRSGPHDDLVLALEAQILERGAGLRRQIVAELGRRPHGRGPVRKQVREDTTWHDRERLPVLERGVDGRLGGLVGVEGNGRTAFQ